MFVGKLISNQVNSPRLHHVFHDIFTDLASHIRADAGREPVVEPGPDAGVRISSAKTPRLGPTVHDAGRGRVGHRSLRDVRGT